MTRYSKRIGRNPTVREGTLGILPAGFSTLSDGRVSALPTKHKHAHSSQAKENNINRDDVIQNLLKATRNQRDHNCQSTLQSNRECRHARAIKPGKLFEKKPIIRHCEIDSWRSQHTLAQESNRGNRDSGCDKASALACRRQAHYGGRWCFCLC